MYNIRNGLGESCNVSSDFSGGAILTDKHGNSIEISAAFLLMITAEYVVRRRIARIEAMTPTEVLETL